MDPRSQRTESGNPLTGNDMTNPNPINQAPRATPGTRVGATLSAPLSEANEARDTSADTSTAGVSPVVRTVAICDTQPVIAAGIRTLLDGNPELKYLETTESLKGALERIEGHAGADAHPADVLLVDKALGVQAILDWLARVRPALDKSGRPGVVIWGVSISEAEALRFLQAGARGILRKTAPVPVVMACLRTVAGGRSWMEDAVFRDIGRSDRYPRSELTAREQQVLELVEQGFKNKEIAQDLGIRPGTVKIHLKHIFEKTGVRGRYGLALNGLKERGVVSIPA
jgi:two-component system, NarL family, nitrate/nitrite response regulator NarL